MLDFSKENAMKEMIRNQEYQDNKKIVSQERENLKLWLIENIN